MIGPIDFWLWTSGAASTDGVPLPLPARASIVAAAAPAAVVAVTAAASIVAASAPASFTE